MRISMKKMISVKTMNQNQDGCRLKEGNPLTVKYG